MTQISESEHRETGRDLNVRWNVFAKQAQFSRTGKRYHPLTRFPAALFDQHGYLLFRTSADYLGSPYLTMNTTSKTLFVRSRGISAVPGYRRMTGNPAMTSAVPSEE